MECNTKRVPSLSTKLTEHVYIYEQLHTNIVSHSIITNIQQTTPYKYLNNALICLPTKILNTNI